MLTRHAFVLLGFVLLVWAAGWAELRDDDDRDDPEGP
jgi:hypothetical protein